MDPELIAYLDARFSHMDSRLDGLEGAVKRNEEATHKLGIQAEALQDEIRQVAEGVANNNEKLEAFREEMSLKLEETRTLIRLSYEDLDRRKLERAS